jgi:hypothetical protein
MMEMLAQLMFVTMRQDVFILLLIASLPLKILQLTKQIQQLSTV